MSLYLGNVTPCSLPVPEQTRSRTPPALKWMLNERAALAGRLQRSARELVPLKEQHAAAMARANALATRVAEAEEKHQEVAHAMQALDTVLQAAFPLVNPAAAGVVNAWAGKYGRPGALKAFLLSVVERSSPEPVTTAELFEAVVWRFKLKLNAAQRTDFRRNLRIALRREAGHIEEVSKSGNRGVIGWRWRTGPSLSQLLSEQGYEAAHPVGAEVGG